MQMKSVQVLFIAVALLCISKEGSAQPQELYHGQILDHYDAQNQGRWFQRYFVNDQFAVGSNPPVFFMLGGESGLSTAYVQANVLQYSIWAQQFGAILVALEHRFYGNSRPTPDMSTANLKYLSSEQALADAADFITWFTATRQVGPIITFGGSYPGNLAAWFRLKYPHLTYGAIASSAPVTATLDMVQYLEVVGKSLDYFAGPQCADYIRTVFGWVDTMLDSDLGRQNLTNIFNTCEPIGTNPDDIAVFVSDLMGPIMGTVQYNLEQRGAATIADICNALDSVQSKDPAEMAIMYQSMLIRDDLSFGCNDISYDNMLMGLSNLTAWDSAERQWTYQTCAEFGYYQTTDALDQPFGNRVPLTWYLQQCQFLFGILPRIQDTNIRYGAAHPSGSNVVFVNGNIDPWHALSVTTPLDPFTIILINGTAHCADMDPPKPSDPPSLIMARKFIFNVLAAWLQ